MSMLRKLTLQTHTLPKNGLLAALSAHGCSLSLNVAELFLETMTGSIHAFESPAAAAITLSVRGTAIAPVPLNAWSSLVEPKLVAMLEWCTREPAAQENLPSAPRFGPKTSSASPLRPGHSRDISAGSRSTQHVRHRRPV